MKYGIGMDSLERPFFYFRNFSLKGDLFHTFIIGKDRISYFLYIPGNTQEDKVLSPIIRYYPIFAAFLKSIIKYYSVSCRQNS